MSEKKTILFPFVGDTLGGSHLATLELIDELLISNYKVVVLLYQEGVLSDYLKENDYEYVLDDGLVFFPKGKVLKSLNKIILANYTSILFLKKNKIDVVHTNDLRMHLSWFVGGSLFSKHIWHQRSVSGKIMIFSVFSTKIVTITNFCKSSFPFFVRKKSILIKDPVVVKDPVSIKKSVFFTDKENIREKEKVLRIVWVANFTKGKRLSDALYIVEKIIKNGQEVKLYVLGEKREPIYSEIKKLIKKLEIENSVVFVGFSKDASSYIVASDVLLATAENEGMGRTLIESMLLGTPVVASAHGGHLDVISDNLSGLLVPLGNIEEFSLAILKIKNDRELCLALTTRAKEIAVQEYSSKKHKDRISELYK